VQAYRVLAAILLTAGMATSAHSQPAAAPPGTGPTPVPRTVFIQTMDTEFRVMDADKNNVLTRKEIEDYQRAVSVVVAQRRNVALFQALDKDKNGTLTQAEFAGLPMNVPPVDAAPVLAQTDGNRDGQVTLVEYRAGKLVNFDRMDIDKDGVVSASEMKAAGLIK
jgi:hypothetical protein